MFEWDSSGYSSCGVPAGAASATKKVNSSATIDESDQDLKTLKCTTPAFMPDMGVSSTGVTDFSLLAVSTSTGAESTVAAAFQNMTKFYFLDDTIIDQSTNFPANGVFVRGVNCEGLDLSFKASQALAQLRMYLEYTPLQPIRGESFVGSTVPSMDEVLRKTDPMPSTLFSDASLLDLSTGDGKYCIGSNAHTLQLPYQGADAPQFKMSKSGEQLNILDNLQQPSSVVIESNTECSPGSVCGRMQWNVSRGWEGYAYQMCLKALPAGIPVWGLDMTKPYVGSRCVYVVVPKCSTCVAPEETLYSIASNYATSWLNLWSVNPELTNTSAVSETDEVWNSPGDMAYPFVKAGMNIRLGIPYAMRAQDSVYEVGRRFGMDFNALLTLNPDVYSGNQDRAMTGGTLCLLASASKYNECPVLAEAPNPLYFEEVTSYDERGVPIKRPNPRYPLPPRPAPPAAAGPT